MRLDPRSGVMSDVPFGASGGTMRLLRVVMGDDDGVGREPVYEVLVEEAHR